MILLHPAHINHITYIQKHNRTPAHFTHSADHILLSLRQTITSSLGLIILILPRSSSNNDQRHIIITSTVQHLLRNFHLLLAPRHTPPALAFIIRILLNPVLINPHQLLIQMNSLTLFQRIQNSHNIPGIHQTTGAQTTLIIMKSHTAKDSHTLSLSQRKHLLLILQQYTTLCRRLSRQRSILLQIQLITIHVLSFPLQKNVPIFITFQNHHCHVTISLDAFFNAFFLSSSYQKNFTLKTLNIYRKIIPHNNRSSPVKRIFAIRFATCS